MSGFQIADLTTFVEKIGRAVDESTATAIANTAADAWVDTARQTMGHDTGQLDRRTTHVSTVTSGGRAVATVEADTPYAVFHDQGTRNQAPNGYWTAGRLMAVQVMRGVFARGRTEIKTRIGSGGVWRPSR